MNSTVQRPLLLAFTSALLAASVAACGAASSHPAAASGSPSSIPVPSTATMAAPVTPAVTSGGSSAAPTDKLNNSGLPSAPTADAKATGGAAVPCAAAPVNGAARSVDCSAQEAAFRVVAGGSNAAAPKAVCAPSELSATVGGKASCLQVNAQPGECIAAPQGKDTARVVPCDDKKAADVIRVTRVNWDTKDEGFCGTGSVRYILSAPDHNGVLCAVDRD